MVAKFQVIDHSSVTYPASERGPARTNHFMHLLDLGECPMRQMPRYQLTDSEVESYAGGKLNGQVVHLEVREMNGAGNPIMRGRIIKAEKQQVAKAA